MTKQFIEFLNEGAADFVAWCEANPTACLRRYQVRDTGKLQRPQVTNGDAEERLVTYEIKIAYPQTERFGAAGALDRDDAIRDDQLQLEAAIGMAAGGNFIAPFPDATWRSSSTAIKRGAAGVDFLVITQTMSYVQQLGAPAPVDVVTNLPTTLGALRDRARELVAAIAPVYLAGDAFIEYRNELAGDFRAWALANPAAALRRYQVRDAGAGEPPTMRNNELETRRDVLEVLVAYPQTQRYGAAAALARDDVMASDQVLLERQLGVQGYANFTGASPNATIVGLEVDRQVLDGIDLLVMTITLEYRRQV